ncbi:hypothetical protein AYI70_g11121 [Smittium culicis]|uniref:Uncharacterized protein n=1 Tax=Smittium culicis TaxID=133412 RepID=A0A1R1X3D5_9FUNG|nr:hypothetical protein AYI70_g11121 [Smittium culicis]
MELNEIKSILSSLDENAYNLALKERVPGNTGEVWTDELEYHFLYGKKLSTSNIHLDYQLIPTCYTSAFLNVAKNFSSITLIEAYKLH